MKERMRKRLREAGIGSMFGVGMAMLALIPALWPNWISEVTLAVGVYIGGIIGAVLGWLETEP